MMTQFEDDCSVFLCDPIATKKPDVERSKDQYCFCSSLACSLTLSHLGLARPGPAPPSQPMDFQTQHQPRLLSGLLEQEWLHRCGWLSDFWPGIVSGLCDQLNSLADKQAEVCADTHTTNTGGGIWQIPLWMLSFCSFLHIDSVTKLKRKQCFNVFVFFCVCLSCRLHFKLHISLELYYLEREIFVW